MSGWKKLIAAPAGGGADGDYYATWSDNAATTYAGSPAFDGAEVYLLDASTQNISGTFYNGISNLNYTDAGALSTFPFYRGTGGDLEATFSTNSTHLAVPLGSNIYACGGANRYATPSWNGAFFQQWTGSTLNYTKLLNSSGYSSQVILQASATDGTDIYCIGTENNTTGNSAAWIVSFDTSGAINWQKSISTTGLNFEAPQSIHFDSSGNIIAAWNNRYNGIGGRDFYIVKFNSSGVVQWQKYIGTTLQDYPLNMALDSSDNIYLSFSYNGTVASVAKLNSSGTVQWCKCWRYHYTVFNVYDGATDPDGNTYLVGRNYHTRGSGAKVQSWRIKVDSSGTLEFAEEWYGTSGVYGFNGTAVNEFGSNLCWSVNMPKDATGEDTLMAKLPPDVQTNTFGNITCYDETSGWAASVFNLTLSTTTPTYTWATTTGISVQKTLSMTSNNVTLSYNTTTIT